MKRTLFTGITATGLAFCIAFGGTACLITGFSLPVDLWTLALWCLLSGVITAFCSGTKAGWIPLGLLGVALIWMWQGGLLPECLESIVYEITLMYHQTYGGPILRWSGRTAAQMAQTLPAALYLLGSLVAMVAGWSVAKGQSAIPGVLCAVPLPLLCLLVKDSTPNIFWLWLLFFGLAMVLLTAAVRYDDPRQGNFLSLYLAVPVALAVTLLFVCIPKNSYKGDALAQQWSQKLFGDTSLAELFQLDGQDALLGVDGVQVDLRELTRRRQSGIAVMEVASTQNGKVYLRSSALDTYDGVRWVDSGTVYPLSWPDPEILQGAGELMITTKYAHSMLYQPYYVTSMDMAQIQRGMENAKKLRYYSFAWAKMPDSAFFEERYPDPMENRYEASGSMMRQGTDLPESTRKWAQKVLEPVLGDTVNYYHKAQRIGAYVRSSAGYDLNPGRMGSREKDFVRWFLEDSPTGYCVHFATAAAVLLKAAGIPARYVTGYLVEVKAGAVTAVTESDAHAWVEYWLPGFGWTVLEATPGNESEYVPPVAEVSKSGQGNKISVRIPWWVWPVAVGGLLFAAVTQAWVRRSIKRRRLYTGQRKQQLLYRYAATEQILSLLGKTPQSGVVALAQRAKFSPHPVTELELERMEAALQNAKNSLRSEKIWKRCWYALYLALP